MAIFLLSLQRVVEETPFLFSSVESCKGGHGLCHHLLEKMRSALLVLGRKG